MLRHHLSAVNRVAVKTKVRELNRQFFDVIRQKFYKRIGILNLCKTPRIRLVIDNGFGRVIIIENFIIPLDFISQRIKVEVGNRRFTELGDNIRNIACKNITARKHHDFSRGKAVPVAVKHVRYPVKADRGFARACRPADNQVFIRAESYSSILLFLNTADYDLEPVRRAFAQRLL